MFLTKSQEFCLGFVTVIVMIVIYFLILHYTK